MADSEEKKKVGGKREGFGIIHTNRESENMVLKMLFRNEVRRVELEVDIFDEGVEPNQVKFKPQQAESRQDHKQPFSFNNFIHQSPSLCGDKDDDVTDDEEELKSCSKYSTPKSSNTTTFFTLLLLSPQSPPKFPVFLFRPRDTLTLIACLLFRATAGENPPSSSPTNPRRDSLTASAGKFSTAAQPLIASAAWSYARAAASALSNVPSQTRTPFRVESRISAANLPHGRRLTPRLSPRELTSDSSLDGSLESELEFELELEWVSDGAMAAAAAPWAKTP
ncbi:protein kinase superfamily protein [Striga asiatica]|uniref:Protein kinase superfamily protein n=1 Tax=Striga asiatica TaxID=4170 RepID=A0A5A7P9Z2_STRAF|nr:protein kinase superfamily protein [Striga asiatica]